MELVCLALQQKREGNTALAEFIANKGENAVSDALAVAKEFGEAESKLARLKKTRLDLLKEAKDDGQCCDGLQWEMVIGCRTTTTKQWYLNQIILRSRLRCSRKREGKVPKHLYSRASKLWKDFHIVAPKKHLQGFLQSSFRLFCMGWG